MGKIKILDGLIEEFYKGTNILKSRTTYVNNIREGRYERFYKPKKYCKNRKEIGNYKNGTIDGVIEIILLGKDKFEKDEIEKRIIFKNGTYIGTFIVKEVEEETFLDALDVKEELFEYLDFELANTLRAIPSYNLEEFITIEDSVLLTTFNDIPYIDDCFWKEERIEAKLLLKIWGNKYNMHSIFASETKEGTKLFKITSYKNSGKNKEYSFGNYDLTQIGNLRENMEISLAYPKEKMKILEIKPL